MANPKTTDKTPGFEKALERLETIVREMEGGALGLEKMMKHFEEGMGLVSLCSRQLNEVERKIEQLVAQGDKTALAPFEPPPDEGADAGPAPDARDAG